MLIGILVFLQIVEQAHNNVSVANSSAAVLFPVPDPADPPIPTGLAANAPLYNSKALQLWILR